MNSTSTTAYEIGVKTWVGFSAMCLGMFMAVLDIQVVVTSLPSIQAALRIEPTQTSWVQTAYLIAEVIAIPLTGFLTRVLSMRGLFVVAIILFTAASISCAMSAGFASLVASRVVQGLAGGVLIPLVFSAVFLLFPFRSQLERTIHRNLGDEIEVESHIEPLLVDAVTGTALPWQEYREIRDTIEALAEETNNLIDAHDIRVRKTPRGLYVSLHCHVPPELTVEVAHDAASELEQKIRAKIEGARRVIVHTEPPAVAVA
jgi:Dimerisation domain of Zinc Transporter/Major Facilitator Superfamily